MPDPTTPTSPPPWPDGMEQDIGNLQDPDDYERRTGQRIDLADSTASTENEPLAAQP